MSTLVNGNGFVINHGNTSLFKECKNHLTSMWDLLFGDQLKEWIGFKPALGAYVFPCFACRHMFSSLTSLQDHVNRRILVLKYNCCHCSSQEFTFYNRCALLLHARLHFSLEEGQIDVSEVYTSVLPLHLAGFLPVPEIPTLYEEAEVVANENVYYNVQFYTPSKQDQEKQFVVLKPNEFVYKEPNQTLVLKQICKNIPKCQFITLEEQTRLKQIPLMRSENESENTDIKVELFDYIDQLTLPVISKVESLHETTYNIPQCLECKSVQDGTMAEHYQGNNKPSDSRLTCTDCKFVASSKCSFNAHIRIHKNEAPHVCPDCGKDFENSDILHKHLNEVCFHLAKNVKFRCFGKRCGKLFASEANLAVHFKQHFQCVYTCSLCSNMLFDQQTVEEHTIFHNGNCSFFSAFQCSLCTDKGILNENEFNSHLDFHSAGSSTGVYVYMCRHCHNYFRSTATFAAHLLKCSSKLLAQTRSLGDCDNCKQKNYCNSKKFLGYCPKAKRPANKKVMVMKKYFCILCNKQIQQEQKPHHMKNCQYSRPFVLLTPIVDNNAVNSPLSSSSDHSIRNDREYKRSSKSGDSPKSDESGKKKRKRNLNLRSRRIEKDTEPDLIAGNPVEFNGTYYCKLCNYKNSLRTEFHTHIRTHRNISTSYQCMECGECFVVKPSLIKHLLHFHNILDYQEYLTENDCYDIKAVKELESIMRLAPGESKEPVKENQCRVCFEVFEDTVTLKKHYRCHGMAFLLKNVK